jgi:NADH-quinone oxidoreductase subunit M
MGLSILILIPLISALAIGVMRKPENVRWTALGGAVIQFFAALLLLFLYEKERASGNQAALVFEEQHKWFSALNINYHVGVDGISVAMILLTAFVVLAGCLVSWNVTYLTREFYFLLIFLSLGAYGFFISFDLIMLFFFLEIAVIPKYLLIGIWGSGNKEYSANKLALMLMGGSALVLVGILGLYFRTGTERSFDLIQLANAHMPLSSQKIFFPLLFIGFGVFGALFPFHTWVPDGHSSAPTAASMFLAGISMKLGGYGCLRVASWLMPEAAKEYSGIIILLSTIAILYGAFATMMQKDLKYINAYSSVSHCGFVLLGIGMLTKTAMTGAVMQMVSHGLMTALFFAVIGMIYERSHTRMVAEMGGMMKVMPFIMTILFMVGFCSLGLPGFTGFVAEMTVFMGSWQKTEIVYRIATVAACMSIIVTAVYILRAVGQTAMGPLAQKELLTVKDARWNEKTAAILLMTGILAIGLAPFWLNRLVQMGMGFYQLVGR